MSAAACAATGSDSSTHGPIFGDDAGDGAATLDGGVHADGATGDAGVGDGSASDASSDVANETSSLGDASVDSGADASGCASTMALLAGGANALVGASFANGQWSSASALSGGTAGGPVAIVPFGTGYAAVGAKSGVTPSLQSTTFTTSWSAPVAIGAAVGKDVLSLAAIGTTLHLVYQSSDSKFYHGTLTGSAWDGATDPVGGSGASQQFGPSGATAATAGGKLVFAQSGSNDFVYDSTLDVTWQSPHQQTGTSVQNTIAPTLVALAGGAADLLIVYARKTDFHLMWSARTGTAWSVPAEVYNVAGNVAYSNDPVSIAPRAGGKAVLAFRGGNLAPYATLFDGATWSAPAAMLTGSPALDAAPTIAPGVCGDDAVAAYSAGGAVSIVRLTGTTWSTPMAISGATAMKYAAIATRP